MGNNYEKKKKKATATEGMRDRDQPTKLKIPVNINGISLSRILWTLLKLDKEGTQKKGQSKMEIDDAAQGLTRAR